MKKGFTLVELLIAIGIVSILSAAVVMVINPVEIQKEARDSERLSDLNSIHSTITLAQSLGKNVYTLTSPQVIYLSLPDNTAATSTCPTYAASLPSLPGGWSYRCVNEANLRKVDGTGWVPINFAALEGTNPLAILPIDPINQVADGYYYTFTVSSWELTCKLESGKYVTLGANDGGYNANRYEFGSDLAILAQTPFGGGVPPPPLPDGSSWAQATANAQWTTRGFHSLIVFNNKMWVMGGQDPNNKNDVWYSTNGVAWAQATSSAQWAGRGGHTSVVYDNKMWVIGGVGDGGYLNNVWYSTDGISWVQATSTAQWAGRMQHTSVVYDNKMWVIGGDTGAWKKDVWYSTNGISWIQATPSAQWTARGGHTSVVYDNKMWVIGGNDAGGLKKDVWYSTDGISWTQATSSAQWAGRGSHASVVFDNKMWVIGGYNGTYKKDVWHSTNGISWTQATSTAQWTGRYSHASVVYDNKIWVTGGQDPSRKNDVWYTQ